jgi:peptidoglycan-associated lipoprotein
MTALVGALDRDGEHHPTLRRMTVMTSSFKPAAVALLMCALTAGACGKKVPPATPQPPPPAPAPTTPTTPPPPAPPPAATPPADRALTEDELFAKMTPEEVAKLLRPVFFALDSIEISEEGRGVLQKNSDFLKRRTSVKVLIEGHADSRGTNEYNLALAERRADAVRDYLVSLGIPNDRVTIVSKGEEQPFCKEETEACWQQNRVGYFIVTAK